jgi:hypothetical protein
VGVVATAIFLLAGAQVLSTAVLTAPPRDRRAVVKAAARASSSPGRPGGSGRGLSARASRRQRCRTCEAEGSGDEGPPRGGARRVGAAARRSAEGAGACDRRRWRAAEGVAVRWIWARRCTERRRIPEPRRAIPSEAKLRVHMNLTTGTKSHRVH